jgi:hypothetical protein
VVASVAGDRQLAARAADFVVDLLELQPDVVEGVYLVRDWHGRLVTDFPPESERFFVLRRGQRRPLYYALGLAVCLLATLHRATGRADYLKPARRYARVCALFAPEIYRHDYSGKLCWGLAILARSTGEASYKRTALAAADHLCSRQNADGSWGVLYADPEDCCTRLDLTAEYSTWLCLVADEMAD